MENMNAERPQEHLQHEPTAFFRNSDTMLSCQVFHTKLQLRDKNNSATTRLENRYLRETSGK